ncbi:hypothetical protein KFL_000720020 [Klebsormidium nitens]|uniref:Uncharacterized protein n=1 Tax=Klebsormidium nitens TaxID=105231 RepID=A0A1Y1HSP5_KLENI|nr:hypothetical protein KFL_000720020 [Klebsormidium nitens]|eukprot:GAQ81133.1 hypothetical protein KFL_000720020 [Klebsormidium nitens]
MTRVLHDAREGFVRDASTSWVKAEPLISTVVPAVARMHATLAELECVLKVLSDELQLVRDTWQTRDMSDAAAEKERVELRRTLRHQKAQPLWAEQRTYVWDRIWPCAPTSGMLSVRVGLRLPGNRTVASTSGQGRAARQHCWDGRDTDARFRFERLDYLVLDAINERSKLQLFIPVAASFGRAAQRSTCCSLLGARSRALSPSVASPTRWSIPSRCHQEISFDLVSEPQVTC